MNRWWRGAALILGNLLGAATVSAQPYVQGTAGAPIPEPIPYGAAAAPSLAPGPLNPFEAPPGPGPDLSLPADHPSAFPIEEPPLESACYFHIGAQGLARQRASHLPFAVVDAQSLDTGALPTADRPLTLDLSQVSQPMQFGPRFTLGYFEGGHGVELTGFYIFDYKKSFGTQNAGRLDSFFINTPVGFEGNNGLWLQADRMTVEQETHFGSAELNYRNWNLGVGHMEVLMGVRYIDLLDRLNFVTDDDGISFPDVNGNPDPRRTALYQVQAKNRIVAPQLGFEWTAIDFLCFSMGLSAKGAWGVNFVEVNTLLERGDRRVGFSGGRNNLQFSHLYDIGGYIDFHILERMRLRAGYNAMWILNVSTAEDAVSFDLRATNGAFDEHGSIFYHGPTIELQFLF